MGAPDDRHPESGDASHFDFDDLVLDEEFVRSATISEASASARVERRRVADLRRARRFPRPQVRRVKRTFRRWWSARPNDRRSRPAPDAPGFAQWSTAQRLVMVAAVALAGLFVWALVDIGGGSHAATGATATTASAGAPSGADPVGTCRGLVAGGNHIAAKRVACSQSHSVEVTGYVVTTSSTKATAAQIASSCEQAARKYTAGQLPSSVKSGSLEVAGTVECTVYETDAAGKVTPTTGSLSRS